MRSWAMQDYTKLLVVAIILFLLIATGCGPESYLQMHDCGACLCLHTPDGKEQTLSCSPTEVQTPAGTVTVTQ